jgi:hypothetical protein
MKNLRFSFFSMFTQLIFQAKKPKIIKDLFKKKKSFSIFFNVICREKCLFCKLLANYYCNLLLRTMF